MSKLYLFEVITVQINIFLVIDSLIGLKSFKENVSSSLGICTIFYLLGREMHIWNTPLIQLVEY